jgi:hypothetical protein
MKTFSTYKYSLVLLAALSISSCSKDFLDQEPTNIISTQQAYSSLDGVNGIAANLYSRVRYEQNFSTDGESYDIAMLDEFYNNSAYGNSDGAMGNGYRTYYDYGLIREINIHLQQLQHVGTAITPAQQKYFIAEARFIRAMVYFQLVARMGGVPIITEPYEYTNQPAAYAKARNKESEVYDFIAEEVDAIAPDLDLSVNGVYTKNRATTGAALALKCRAMLYAGSLAKNDVVSRSKNVILQSGAVGIPAAMANGYFGKCLDAFTKLKAKGYALYQANANLSENFTNVFLKKGSENKELIFIRDYDGVNVLNTFTQRAIPRSQRTVDNSGSQLNPTLNLAESFEVVASHANTPFKTNTGAEVIEDMETQTSNQSYVVYDNAADIFQGRDPRLAGTILTPGSQFRGKDVQLQAGLAVWNGSGYNFNAVDVIENASTAAGLYNGVQKTGIDGPHFKSFYTSHSGFLLRKFVDPDPGSEATGKSDVPYVIFRYGEMLLNAAEAAFQLGRTAEALGYINEVRARAGGDAFKITAGELTLERIMNERKVELAGEDHRFYDTKRWRIADEIWNGSLNSNTAVLYALWPYKIYRPGHATDGKWIYRRLRLRGTHIINGAIKQPLKFNVGLYYSEIPGDALGNNPLLEKNPNQ